MKVQHLRTMNDLSDQTVDLILAQANKVKESPKKYVTQFEGKTLGLLFEKPSTRTRISFEVGMAQLGGSSFNLNEIKVDGKREEVRDIARVLSRYLDVVVLRTFDHERIDEFAKYSTIPVINGLSDLNHPCQALSDLFTIREKLGLKKNLTVAYVGDGNNVLYSLMHLFPRKNITMHIATPKQYGPSVKKAPWMRQKPFAKYLQFFNNPAEAVRGADVIYTDVWVSMGQEKLAQKKIKAFKGFQVNAALLKKANAGVKVMHCLPCHRGYEISDEVVEGKHSIVLDQAENRMHVQKAILLKLVK